MVRETNVSQGDTESAGGDADESDDYVVETGDSRNYCRIHQHREGANHPQILWLQKD